MIRNVIYNKNQNNALIMIKITQNYIIILFRAKKFLKNYRIKLMMIKKIIINLILLNKQKI